MRRIAFKHLDNKVLRGDSWCMISTCFGDDSSGTDLLSTAQDIRLLASVITKLAKRDLEQRLASYGTALTALQYGVLRTLVEGPRTLSDMSRQFAVEPATLVPVIDALERKGLARRGADPHDRRRSPLSITEHGETILARVPFLDPHDSLVASLNNLGDEKAQQLRNLLHDLALALTENETVATSVSPSSNGRSPSLETAPEINVESAPVV